MVHESIFRDECRDIGSTTLRSGARLAIANSVGVTSSHANLHGVLGKCNKPLNDVVCVEVYKGSYLIYDNSCPGANESGDDCHATTLLRILAI